MFSPAFLQHRDLDNFTTSSALYAGYKRWLNRFHSPAVVSRESKDLVDKENAQRAFIKQALQYG